MMVIITVTANIVFICLFIFQDSEGPHVPEGEGV